MGLARAELFEAIQSGHWSGIVVHGSRGYGFTIRVALDRSN